MIETIKNGHPLNLRHDFICEACHSMPMAFAEMVQHMAKDHATETAPILLDIIKAMKEERDCCIRAEHTTEESVYDAWLDARDALNKLIDEVVRKDGNR